MTKGVKGTKEARFDLLPWDALWQVARVFGFGATKYAERNWEGGYKWSASKAALDRHLALFWQGQDTDEEFGLLHLAHVAWHALVLLAFALRGVGEDDRPKATYNTMTAEVTNPEIFEDRKIIIYNNQDEAEAQSMVANSPKATRLMREAMGIREA